MGFSKKKQHRPKPSLKPVNTRQRDAAPSGEDVTMPAPTTPTAKEFRIPERLPCPPAPRKRRPVSMTAGFCHYAGAREFFVPPDLETVFKLHLERAK